MRLVWEVPDLIAVPLHSTVAEWRLNQLLDLEQIVAAILARLRPVRRTVHRAQEAIIRDALEMWEAVHCHVRHRAADRGRSDDSSQHIRQQVERAAVGPLGGLRNGFRLSGS